MLIHLLIVGVAVEILAIVILVNDWYNKIKEKEK
jgi:hypothetical protein